MGKFLEALRQPDGCHLIEPTDSGFTIIRRDVDCAEAFNRLAREAIKQSGVDYVALPRTDGPARYDRVFIIPLD